MPGIHALIESLSKTWMAGTSLDKRGHDDVESHRPSTSSKLCKDTNRHPVRRLRIGVPRFLL
jgi:hypothetical protein